MKPNIKGFLYLLVLVFFAFSNKVVFAQEFWDIPIKEIVKSGSFAKITTDSKGKNVYVVYSSKKLNIKKSSDYGASFSPSIELGTSLNSSPQITTNNSGEYIYLIWVENTKVFSSASSDYGVSFIDPIELDASEIESSINQPKIITNETGQYVYAVWVEDFSQIKMRISTDFGTRFSDIIKIASGSNPHLITDTTGKNVIISFEDDSVQVRVSSDFGKNFSDPITLDKTGFNQESAASLDTENIYVIWQDETNNLQFSASSDFGINWYAPLKFSSNGSYTIDMTTNDTGEHVYFVWNDGNNNIQVKISEDYGKGFSTINLNEKGTYPKIITDNTGQYIFLIWLDSDYNVKFRISTNFGINFDPAIKLTESVESMFTYPDITIDNAGKFIHILWNAQGGAIKTIDGARLFSNENNLKN